MESNIKPSNRIDQSRTLSAFTIVELLIVIVVIGILAAITIVSFSGITSQANVASVKSDLDSNSRKLQLYYSQYGSYPTQFDANKCPTAPTVDTNYCLKLSGSNSLSNYAASNTNFTLGISNGATCYQLTDSTSPTNICASSNGYTAEQLLSTATWWIDSAYSTNNQTITNLGTGGAILNATNGSTQNTDTNDAQYLPYDGTPYVYLPGVAGNYLSVPDENALDIKGDLDIRVKVALDDWTPSTTQYLLSKLTTGGGYSYALGLSTNGRPFLTWSSDGINPVENGKDATAAIPSQDGSAKWVRGVLDINNGGGQFDVKFYVSDDGNSWIQLGSVVTGTTGTTSIYSGNSNLNIGGYNSGSAGSSALKIYKTQIYNGIDGVNILDVDTSVLTTGSATSFSAKTGQTVTINRTTSGRKSVAVVSSPVWLLGTDDYAEVADNDILDFNINDSFSALAVYRIWSTPRTYQEYLSKYSTGPGWTIANNLTGNNQRYQLWDGLSTVVTGNSSYTLGQVAVMGGVRDSNSDVITAYTNGIATTNVNDTSVASLANDLNMRIGGWAGGGSYADGELIAAAVFRRALTQAEITTISNYYTARVK